MARTSPAQYLSRKTHFSQGTTLCRCKKLARRLKGLLCESLLLDRAMLGQSVAVQQGRLFNSHSESQTRVLPFVLSELSNSIRALVASCAAVKAKLIAANASHELTFKPNQSSGAGQAPCRPDGVCHRHIPSGRCR